MIRFDEDGHLVPKNLCSFGISEAIAGVISAVAASAGVGATTAGLIGEGVGGLVVGGLEGGALGAVKAAITGEPILKGVESGAITGGVLSAGGPLLESAGLGATGADVLAGAAGGALGSAATHGNVLSGALTGAAAGGITSALAPGSPGSTSGAPTGGGATGAAAQAAPASVAAAAPPAGDVTAAATGAPTNIVPAGLTANPSTEGIASATTPAATGAANGGFFDRVGNFLGLNNTPTTGAATASPTTGSTPTTGNAPATPASTSWLGRNSNWLVPAAGFAYSAIKGDQQFPEQKALESAAASETAQARTLQSYIENGTLPQGVQAGIDQATNAAIASVRSQYAAVGDQGSSAEQQDIAAVQLRAKAQGAQIALGLLQSGLNEQQMADQLYAELLTTSMQQDTALASSFGTFASSLVGAKAAA